MGNLHKAIEYFGKISISNSAKNDISIEINNTSVSFVIHNVGRVVVFDTDILFIIVPFDSHIRKFIINYIMDIAFLGDVYKRIAEIVESSDNCT